MHRRHDHFTHQDRLSACLREFEILLNFFLSAACSVVSRSTSTSLNTTQQFSDRNWPVEAYRKWTYMLGFVAFTHRMPPLALYIGASSLRSGGPSIKALVMAN